MIKIKNIFSRKIKNSSSTIPYSLFPIPSQECGAMLTELLLTIALAALIMPFLLRFQQGRITRAENIAVANEMSVVRDALERYIDANKMELLRPTGKNITRVRVSDLERYGVSDTNADKFQMRVLKTLDSNNRTSLQGIVVMDDSGISPIRTRQIINLGNGTMGFAENGRAYGAYGAWKLSAIDMGINNVTGIIERTDILHDANEYLWRNPSDNASNSTMLSNLNLGGHNVIGAKNIDADVVRFDEMMSAKTIAARRTTFDTRITLDNNLNGGVATVAGTLSADSRSMEISGTLTLNGIAKFSNMTVDDLWVNDLNLAGITISSDTDVATLSVNQTIDMVAGRITAMQTMVGFAGSITPRLVVSGRIEDSQNPDYFWDTSGNTARFADAQLMELNRMASEVASDEALDTDSAKIWARVAGNRNATVADFMNAISQIQRTVRGKYESIKSLE